jgi:hypothetical protein
MLHKGVKLLYKKGFGDTWQGFFVVNPERIALRNMAEQCGRDVLLINSANGNRFANTFMAV